MFQSFDDTSESHLSAARVLLLREELKRQGLSGFLVPRQDEFQGEYVAGYAERLRWLTGFAGSWGMAILMLDRGAIFVDGRYTIQVREQVNTDLFEPQHLVDNPPAKWLESQLRAGEIVGYDPWLITTEQAERFAKACETAGAKLIAVNQNPIDTIWTNQPPRPQGTISVQPTQFAGRTAREKVKDVALALEKNGADAVVLTQPDSTAWVFNIRGEDVKYTPVVLAYAILHRGEQAELFVDPAKLSEDAEYQLRNIAQVKPPSAFEASLAALGAKHKKVQIDPDQAPARVNTLLKDSGATIIAGRDPCTLPKARKNAIEQEGARAAHRRDGIAMCRFLHWLQAAAQTGAETEISAAIKLAEFREATGQLKDLSFDAISAAGPHAAIPHYRVSEASSLPLRLNSIYLIDSGGQYQDGTTDITRTVIVGTPTPEMRDRFTRVLKGMIGVSLIRFPKGTTGSQIDVLARQALWNAGLDYDHGTGHGVGSFLSVHEGPARINKTDRTPLEPGMILSNEPGYYKADAYGIRIENLLLVREAEPIANGERAMHWFETLTLCPIDRNLIDGALLSVEERAFLNAYHARVLKEVGAFLEGDELSWLKAACAAVA
jgi:Xaa-Pro aminopeptidase